MQLLRINGKLAALIVGLAILVSAMAACGSADTGATPSGAATSPPSPTLAVEQETPPAPATPAQPATPQAPASTPVSAAPAATATPAATPASGDTPSPVAVVTETPTAAAIHSNRGISLSDVIQRPCEYEYRDMILAFALLDGPESFGPEVARRLSDEFLELRPDCAAEGWAPEFSDEVLVCKEAGPTWVGAGGLTYSITSSSPTMYSPTVSALSRPFPGETGAVWVMVHFDRMPLYSTFEVKGETVAGVKVGGCWGYQGLVDGRGTWWRGMSPYTYRGTNMYGDPKYVATGGDVRDDEIPPFHPECENVLRTVIQERVLAGNRMDSADVAQAIEAVVVLVPDVCFIERELGYMGNWDPAFANSVTGACSVADDTGVLDDGSFVIHWDPEYTDASGGSACWTMTPEGNWSAHPR